MLSHLEVAAVRSFIDRHIRWVRQVVLYTVNLSFPPHYTTHSDALLAGLHKENGGQVEDKENGVRLRVKKMGVRLRVKKMGVRLRVKKIG